MYQAQAQSQQQQIIMQPQQQTQGGQPPLQQPNDQQLMEGLSEYNPQIVSQPEPIRVSGGKDGVGMSEGCARNPHILTWILTLLVWMSIFSLIICIAAIGGDDGGYCGFFGMVSCLHVFISL